MPSRQERRKAERDAAKRAPGQAGAGGAAGAAAAAAALANLNVNVDPGGDWTTQAPDPAVLFRALGPEILKQRAAEGDREAQFTLGCRLVSEADGLAGPLGTAGRSQQADVGFALCTAHVPVAHKTEWRRRYHLTPTCFEGSNPRQRRAWR
jgi:hypothetical protein